MVYGVKLLSRWRYCTNDGERAGPLLMWAGFVTLAPPITAAPRVSEVYPSAASVLADSSSSRKDGQRLYGPQNPSPAVPEPADPAGLSRWRGRAERAPQAQAQAGSERWAAGWELRCAAAAGVRGSAVDSGSALTAAAHHQQPRTLQRAAGQVRFTRDTRVLWYYMKLQQYL